MTTTITTAGNTDVLIRKPEALIITIFIMFSGIIFYGYLFRQMMNVLSLMKTFQQTEEMRKNERDSWLLLRENGNKSGQTFFSKKQEQIFDFAASFNIPGVFNHDFY